MFNLGVLIIICLGVAVVVCVVLRENSGGGSIVPRYVIAHDFSSVLNHEKAETGLGECPEWLAIHATDEYILYCEYGSVIYNIAECKLPLYSHEVVVLPKSCRQTTRVLLNTTHSRIAKVRFLVLKKYPHELKEDGKNKWL